MIIFSYIYSLLGLGFLVLIHELGHFCFCKLFHIPVSEFSIGMGPKIFTKMYHGTQYSLRAIPTGGFVAIGEEQDKNLLSQAEEEIHILYKQKWYQSTAVLLGGIFNNIMFSYIVITIALSFFPQESTETSLKLFIPQKEITIIDKENNKIVCNETTALELLNKTQEKKFTLTDKNNNRHILTKEEFTNNYKIDYTVYVFGQTIKEKLLLGISTTNSIIYQSFIGILQLFKGINLNKLSGPIGIFKSGSSAATKGFLDFIIFLALISISLAVLNVLPIPIVDGGQFFLMSIYKLFGYGVPQALQHVLTYCSFALIAIMTLYSTYNDIIRLFFA